MSLVTNSFNANNQEADCERRLKGGTDEVSTVTPFNANNQEADCERRLKGGTDEVSTVTPFNANNQEDNMIIYLILKLINYKKLFTTAKKQL